ncbi:hypothetical protein Cgig2_028860 [Carnegiea gigantea]|uniref:ABC transporter domain-containing protein n=1 Tax=Carnegiea gigantea TaxID=171969 RepID=A0A9Q1KSB4_9CARY|nr:hypothetical protein Cgig2_028860 [Carnegiea gigantea]
MPDYAMQDDFLFPMLTVVRPSCSLQSIASQEPNQSRRKEKLINKLRLRDAANTIIEDEGHGGVSTGKRRRVSIGIDIIDGPINLFFDEPTSGLDSNQCILMVSVLQGIARVGSIVILIIHHPSSRILSLLDLLIIPSSGHIVYGEPGSDLSEFFAACNHPIPEYENRAEFALDLISKLEDSPDGITKVEFNKSWNTGEISRVHATNLRAMPLKDARKILTSVELILAFVNPFYVEIYVLANRSLINSGRMPESFGYRFGALILSAVMLGTICWQ